MNQDLINLGITFFAASVGWTMKSLWEAIKLLQKEIKDVERQLHTQYVSKDDYRQDLVEIKDMLKQIFDKMDKKADK
jgi:antirestriction protein